MSGVLLREEDGQEAPPPGEDMRCVSYCLELRRALLLVTEPDEEEGGRYTNQLQKLSVPFLARLFARSSMLRHSPPALKPPTLHLIPHILSVASRLVVQAFIQRSAFEQHACGRASRVVGLSQLVLCRLLLALVISGRGEWYNSSNNERRLSTSDTFGGEELWRKTKRAFALSGA